MAFCTRCGTPVGETLRFCTRCGAGRNSASPVAPPNPEVGQTPSASQAGRSVSTATARSANDSKMAAETSSVEKQRMEKFAQKLHRAATENQLTQQQYDQLHAELIAFDEGGVFWTVGLVNRTWHRSIGTGWVQDQPPDKLTMFAKAFDQFIDLEKQAGRRGSR